MGPCLVFVALFPIHFLVVCLGLLFFHFLIFHDEVPVLYLVQSSGCQVGSIHEWRHSCFCINFFEIGDRNFFNDLISSLRYLTTLSSQSKILILPSYTVARFTYSLLSYSLKSGANFVTLQMLDMTLCFESAVIKSQCVKSDSEMNVKV